MVIWALDSKSPSLTLPCFSPLIKGSDHCSLHFLRVFFFQGRGRGKGSTQRDKIHRINAFENGNFCQGFANDKNKFKLLDQKRIQKSHGIQGQE